MLDRLKKLFRPADAEYHEPDPPAPVVPVAPPTSSPAPAFPVDVEPAEPPRE